MNIFIISKFFKISEECALLDLQFYVTMKPLNGIDFPFTRGKFLRVKSDDRKKGIIRSILNYSKANNYPPTQSEIALELKMPVSRINSYVAELANQGYIRAQAHISRSLVVTEKGIDFCNHTPYPVSKRRRTFYIKSNRNTYKSQRYKNNFESKYVLDLPRFSNVFEMFYFSESNLKRIYKFKAVKNSKILHVSEGDEIFVKACKELKKGEWFVASYKNDYFMQCFASARLPKIAVTTDEEAILLRKNATDNTLIVGKVIRLIRNLD